MQFVNEIAEITHGTVDSMTGAPNKNIGEAFLFAWKFPSQFVQQDKQGQLSLKESKVTHQIADLALIAFVKIVANINLS
jgi:hypothetical protein